MPEVAESAAWSAESTALDSPNASPPADNRAIRMTAIPLADSQPKKAAPQEIPPKRAFCAATTCCRSLRPMPRCRSTSGSVAVALPVVAGAGDVRAGDAGAGDAAGTGWLGMVVVRSTGVYWAVG